MHEYKFLSKQPGGQHFLQRNVQRSARVSQSTDKVEAQKQAGEKCQYLCNNATLSGDKSRQIGLTDLPNEILIIIGNMLYQTWDLNSLAQTSRRFYPLLMEALYRKGIDYCYHRKSNHQATRVLYWAIEKRIYSVFYALLDRGANIRYQGAPNGRTLLHLAAAHGDEKIVEVLLERGASEWMTACDYTKHPWQIQYTPVCAAVAAGHNQLANRLLETVDSATRDQIKSAALVVAVFHGNADMVEQLLESGTNTTGSSFYQDGFHPLHAAALTGNLPFVKMLREAGAKTANRGWIRATELHYAARSASSECVQFFLDIGISVNAQTLHGDTPLHWAAEIGNSDVIKTLLRAGADVNAEGQNANFSPLHRAVGSGQVAAAKQLINAGANVFPQRQGSDYASLIYQLVHQRGGPELLELLLELGYDINKTTVLHTATWNHNEVVITQLINHGADISRRNSDGNTALHEAAKIGCTKSVKALLDGGADINERNEKGYTPIHLAIMSFRTGILEYLIASGADINAQGGDGLTPLETAAYRNPCNVMVKMLLDAGARNPWVESGLIEMTICDTSDEDDDEYDYY